MQRIFDFFQRARQRINARIAILVVVTALGGVAVWQGFRHMAANKPVAKGPTKQVATGPHKLLKAVVQNAAATLTDDQLPGASGTHHLVVGYTDAENPPATNPYQVNPYAEPAQPSSTPPGAMPPDPTVPGSEYAPTTDGGSSLYNPYRASLSDDSAAPPPTAEYAAASEAPAEIPAEDPLAAYQRQFGVKADANLAPVSEAPPATLAPSATLGPTTELSASPYATQPQAIDTPPAETPPTRSLLGAGSGASAGQNPYATSADSLANPSPAIGPLAGSESAGRAATPTPGEHQLAGPQQPAITIEKFAPAEIQVGKEATFELVVRNAGQVPAQNVVITDHVPAGTQLVSVKPQPSQGADGSLVWQLGLMQPGDEQTIALQVMPQTEGELGSTAQVTFSAQATSRSICTRPQLTIEHTTPPKVLIGESLAMAITVTNPGSGAATGVMIEEDVPAGLSHIAGTQLEYEVGTLLPGESKRLELSLRAEQAGLIENIIRVRGEGNLSATHRSQIEVVAPQLEVAVNGPTTRFMERQAEFTVSITNPGTAPARAVELVASLPKGMQFVECDSQGQYDPAQHAVFWSLEELPAAQGGSVKLTTLPIEPGEQRLQIVGRANLGLTAETDQVVQVQQSAELLHTVKDTDEVIEVGSETTYMITVRNAGRKAATNVRIAALLPAELQAISGEGPTQHSGDASQIMFEPLPQLNPDEEVTYKVLAKGVAAGIHKVQVQLSSDELSTPVTREESTRVYVDR